MRSHDYNPRLIMEYLEDVLNYYKTSDNPSFFKWPTEEIGWVQFTRDEKRFYPIVDTWFGDRGINTLRYNGRRRYLSTFILAAEFPPTLGFQDHISRLVQRNGWHSIYKNPTTCLQCYIDSLHIENLTVAEKQFLTQDSDGFYAFIELIKILSTIRFLLGKFETLEEICVNIASKKELDIDLIQRIATSYKSVLTPDQTTGSNLPNPKFEYYMQIIDGDVSLKIKHNLNKIVQVPLPSSTNLNRFSMASVTAISRDKPLPIFSTSEAVSLEVEDSSISADFGLSSEYFSVKNRNIGLKDISFYLTAKNKYNEFTTINLGKIKRTEDFLVFDESGREIINAQRSYKMGQKLFFVPLSWEIGKAFQSSSHFMQQNYINLPVFSIIDEPEKVVIGDITLSFCDIPFTIEIREQTPWELAFKERGSARPYFFSSNFSFVLKGNLEGVPTPMVELVRIVRKNGKKIKIPIQYTFKDGIIAPKHPLSKPGLFRLTIDFNNKSVRKQYVRLLPIRSVRLINERQLQLRFFQPPIAFEIQGKQNCSCDVDGDKAEVAFPDYGLYQIDARYTFQTIDSLGNQISLTTPIRFHFHAQQEVVGHFLKIITGISEQQLSLKKDFLPGSYFEFRRSALRQYTESYIIVACMEGDPGKGIKPIEKRYPVRGEDAYSLSDIEQFVTKHGYSRLLLLVLNKKEELFRAEFVDDLSEIFSLEDEWDRGYYHELIALPISTLEVSSINNPQRVPDNSIVYGVVEDDAGEMQIATHGKYYPVEFPMNLAPLEYMLSMVADRLTPREDKLAALEPVFKDPQLAYEFVSWFTKASGWDYPYDIIPFVRLIQDFPIIAVWADIARIPEKLDTVIPLIQKEAQFSLEIDEYIIPNVRNITAYPMFLPELVTLEDFRILEKMGLMIGLDASLKKASFFYMHPFSECGKPVLSWVSTFWIRHIASRHHKSRQVKNNWDCFGKNLSPQIKYYYETNQDNIPKYKNDKVKSQDIWDMFSQEQIHYINPMISMIPTLPDFFNRLAEDSFSDGLLILFSSSPLILAKPYIVGFQESSKWKCIIFLSLYAVCWQIEKTTILDRLKELYHLNKSEYAYLIRWITSNTDTSYIFDAYYEYWMQLFWEEDDV